MVPAGRLTTSRGVRGEGLPVRPHLQTGQGRGGDAFADFFLTCQRRLQMFGRCVPIQKQTGWQTLCFTHWNGIFPRHLTEDLQYRSVGERWVSDSVAAVRSRGRLLHRPPPSVGTRDCSHLLPLSTFFISESSYLSM